jgi:hypothetical protein
MAARAALDAFLAPLQSASDGDVDEALADYMAGLLEDGDADEDAVQQLADLLREVAPAFAARSAERQTADVLGLIEVGLAGLRATGTCARMRVRMGAREFVPRARLVRAPAGAATRGAGARAQSQQERFHQSRLPTRPHAAAAASAPPSPAAAAAAPTPARPQAAARRPPTS